MFDVDKYIDDNGECAFDKYRQQLIDSGQLSEVKRINHYVRLLEEHGYKLPSISEEYAKYLEDDIYELRPSKNRVLYFYCASNGKYVLLHCFRKKTNKTPPKQIALAKKEASDYERKIIYGE